MGLRSCFNSPIRAVAAILAVIFVLQIIVVILLGESPDLDLDESPFVHNNILFRTANTDASRLDGSSEVGAALVVDRPSRKLRGALLSSASPDSSQAVGERLPLVINGVAAGRRRSKGGTKKTLETKHSSTAVTRQSGSSATSENNKALRLLQAAAGQGSSGHTVMPGAASPLAAPGPTFWCLDGRGGPFPETSRNDDYCDCGDGSDEPATSACSGLAARAAAATAGGGAGTGAAAGAATGRAFGQEAASFACAELAPGVPSRHLFSSRVSDGVCDCCDGSDEPPASRADSSNPITTPPPRATLTLITLTIVPTSPPPPRAREPR